ncbi:hypothetical protein GNI_153130, partial [Gregarina niphandrodes]
ATDSGGLGRRTHRLGGRHQPAAPDFFEGSRAPPADMLGVAGFAPTTQPNRAQLAPRPPDSNPRLTGSDAVHPASCPCWLHPLRFYKHPSTPPHPPSSGNPRDISFRPHNSSAVSLAKPSANIFFIAAATRTTSSE